MFVVVDIRGLHVSFMFQAWRMRLVYIEPRAWYTRNNPGNPWCRAPNQPPFGIAIEFLVRFMLWILDLWMVIMFGVNGTNRKLIRDWILITAKSWDWNKHHDYSGNKNILGWWENHSDFTVVFTRCDYPLPLYFSSECHIRSLHLLLGDDTQENLQLKYACSCDNYTTWTAEVLHFLLYRWLVQTCV